MLIEKINGVEHIIPEPSDYKMRKMSMIVEDGEGTIEVVLERTPLLIAIALSLGPMLQSIKAQNYLETGIDMDIGDGDKRYIVTIAYQDGLSPHQARMAAERRVSELQDEVEYLRRKVDGSMGSG